MKPQRPADPPPAPSAANARSTPEAPTGDYSSPPVDPSQKPDAAPSRHATFDPGRATVIDEETTATKKVFRNPDGSYTAQVSPRPTRFKDQNGK